MFRIIAVDDEKRALERFERVMREDTRVMIAGTFTRAEEAIKFTRGNPVDIAFLDIEMPGMSGLKLAETLGEINPLIETVFITAYDSYALKAFQAHAVGYLLKPLDKDEVRAQIDNLYRKLRHEPRTSKINFLTVKCFGPFACYPEEIETDHIRWRTTKSEELFALLIHYHDKAIPKEMIIDTLWPEVEPEKAANHFRVTCTYFRNTLAGKGFTDMLLRERDSYRINTAYLHCDLFEFLPAANAFSSLPVSLLEEASALYTGGYFENKPYEWAERMKTWLENRYKEIQHELTDRYLSQGEYKKARKALKQVLMHDALDEEAVERLISLELKTGDNISAMKVYREYEQRILGELGIPPSEKLQSMF